jgi:hypothetical protein
MVGMASEEGENGCELGGRIWKEGKGVEGNARGKMAANFDFLRR